MLNQPTAPMIGKYAYSLNGDEYRGVFETREKAVTAAVAAAHASSQSPQTVYVGRMVEADPKASGHARMVLSNMGARAREEFGDAASQYLANLPKAKIEQLDNALETVIRGWLQENALIPTFFKIESVSEYPVPSPSQRQMQAENAETREIGSGDYSS